jgi:hypothetical protein
MTAASFRCIHTCSHSQVSCSSPLYYMHGSVERGPGQILDFFSHPCAVLADRCRPPRTTPTLNCHKPQARASTTLQPAFGGRPAKFVRDILPQPRIRSWRKLSQKTAHNRRLHQPLFPSLTSKQSRACFGSGYGVVASPQKPGTQARPSGDFWTLRIAHRACGALGHVPTLPPPLPHRTSAKPELYWNHNSPQLSCSCLHHASGRKALDSRPPALPHLQQPTTGCLLLAPDLPRPHGSLRRTG